MDMVNMDMINMDVVDISKSRTFLQGVPEKSVFLEKDDTTSLASQFLIWEVI